MNFHIFGFRIINKSIGIGEGEARLRWVQIADFHNVARRHLVEMFFSHGFFRCIGENVVGGVNRY